MEKRNQGYTLVELLAVIVILGILALISILSITQIIDRSKRQAFVSNAYVLKDAAQIYVKDTILQGGTIDQVSYETLVTEELIEPITDPFTKNPIIASGNPSFLTVEGDRITGVCFYGETKVLCASDEEDVSLDKAIAFSEISSEDVVDKQ
ncbi:type II secretion system protein [Bacillus coahuilensis]|uniref:type II secretion system protein n=1 Tax=Bacillus coahuilensis TaxID=408580 RepID=UPI0001851177|nr:type II secretion system protein [Bacillus coahuilensis]